MSNPGLHFSNRFFRKGHYTVLLFSLGLFLFVLYPLLIGHGFLLVLLRVAFMFVLFSACYAVARDRRSFRIAVVLALLTAMASWGGTLWDQVRLAHLSGLLAIAFYIWICLLLLRHVLGDDPVTLDKLFGSICVYMLFGLLWAEIYSLLHGLDPGSFTISQGLQPGVGVGGAGSPASVFVYYSFVTLTTLGYGDISPLEPVPRAMASLEAIVGPLYLAILVARLVSVMDPKRKGGGPDEPRR